MNQGDRLHQIIAHAYECSPAARAQFERAGLQPADIQVEADLEKLPVTRKQALLELQGKAPPFGGFLGVPLERLQRVFMSPGPIYDPQGEGEDYWRWAQALRAAGFRAGDVVHNTFSYHLTPAGFMFDCGARVLGCTVIPAGVGNTEHQVRMMRDLRVTAFTGVPSFLMTIIQKAGEMGFEFRRDFALRRAFFTAEMLPSSLRRKLEEDYGIDTYQGYGTADLGCVAYECSEKQGLHLAAGVVVEVVDPRSGHRVPPGEVGEIVVTLLERAYPLLRFGTGDLSYLLEEPCPCGLSTPRLAGVLGRADDAVKVRGIFIHSRQLEEVMKRFPQVARYQAVVTREGHQDELTIRVELDPAVEPATFSREGLPRLEEQAREVLRLRATVQAVNTGTIPKGDKLLVDRRKWD